METIARDNLGLAQLAKSNSMAEFFSLEEVRNHPSVNIAMVRMLTERIPAWRWERRIQSQQPLPEPDVRCAIERLSNMRSFGILERFEESVALIFQSLVIDVPDVIEPLMVLDRIVTEDQGLEPVQREQVTAKVKKALEQLTQHDRTLYQAALKLFQKKRKHPRQPHDS